MSEDSFLEEILEKMHRDFLDRDMPGLIVVEPGDEHNAKQKLKRLPDGRWYQWLSGAERWQRATANVDAEAVFQAGIKVGEQKKE